jgi:hypothetical protein
MWPKKAPDPQTLAVGAYHRHSFEHIKADHTGGSAVVPCNTGPKRLGNPASAAYPQICDHPGAVSLRGSKWRTELHEVGYFPVHNQHPFMSHDHHSKQQWE